MRTTTTITCDCENVACPHEAGSCKAPSIVRTKLYGMTANLCARCSRKVTAQQPTSDSTLLARLQAHGHDMLATFRDAMNSPRITPDVEQALIVLVVDCIAVARDFEDALDATDPREQVAMFFEQVRTRRKIGDLRRLRDLRNASEEAWKRCALNLAGTINGEQQKAALREMQLAMADWDAAIDAAERDVPNDARAALWSASRYAKRWGGDWCEQQALDLIVPEVRKS